MIIGLPNTLYLTDWLVGSVGDELAFSRSTTHPHPLLTENQESLIFRIP